MPEHLLLMFAVMPLWLGAGLADWALHKRSRIEDTAGVRESLLHMLMLAEMGVAVFAVLWLEVSAGVLALCLLAFVAHELTVYVDLRWSAPRRTIAPLEQMVHSAQEMLPLVALALLASAHWDQALVLAGAGEAEPSFALERRSHPLPDGYLVALFAACLLLGGCYVEELWRCARAGRGPEPQPEPSRIEPLD